MRKIIFILAGGAAGAVLRFLIKGLRISADFPLGTLAINVLGSFLLALILTALMGRFKQHEDLRDGITMGFMGAFTTFSSVCQESAALWIEGRGATAVVYLVLSIALGMTAAFARIPAGRATYEQKHRREEGLLMDILLVGLGGAAGRST